MWTKPGYRPEQAPTPPAETVQRLATIPRGQAEELRVSLAEYLGHPYVSIRVWALGNDGQFWPVKGKGVSVRMKELIDVAKSLTLALSLVEGPARGGSVPVRRGGRQGPRGQSLAGGELPGLNAPDPKFDEFGGSV